MFDRAAIARPLGHCRIVGRSKQSREARGASGRSSMHTFSARAPSRRAVFSRFPRPTPCARSNDQSGKCAHCSTLGLETATVRRAQKLASLFSGALAISLFISALIPATKSQWGNVPGPYVCRQIVIKWWRDPGLFRQSLCTHVLWGRSMKVRACQRVT